MSSEGGDDDVFLLYGPGIIHNLRNRDFFLCAVSQFYLRMAATYGCRISVSNRRIGEAHDFWLWDVKCTLDHATDDQTIELDHFKHAAFIAHWLQRFLPINDIYYDPHPKADGAPSAAQIQFSRYGAELCALFAGFYICLGYETHSVAAQADPPVSVISDAIGVKSLPPYFLSEYPKLLKQKSISPEALYMLFRSLFVQLEWEVAVRSSGAA